MNRFQVYIVICDFDDFVKSIFVDNNEDNYLIAETYIYSYELLTINDKTNEQMLFSLLYNFILSFHNGKVNYSYYGYYSKKNYQ